MTNKNKKEKKIIAVSHLKILIILGLCNGSISNRELRNLLKMSETNLANKTKVLIKRGLITKDNKRPLTIYLTRKGKNMMKQLLVDFLKYLSYSRRKCAKCENCKRKSLDDCIKCRYIQLLID